MLHLPGDEMKGRIIGREGRNIRAFESVTGVNLIIDDTPEAVLLSCFDPVRREVGRLTLDTSSSTAGSTRSGSRRPTSGARPRWSSCASARGEDALVELGITDLHPELVTLLGQLRYRTSYGQNVLGHLVESAHIAGMMASELGLDPALLKRCTVLHDIGKALTHEVEGSHALIGAEIARKYGESDDVVHAIEAHHNEVEVRDGRGGAHPGRRRHQRRAPGRPAGVAGGVRQAAGAAGGDRHRPRRRGEGLRDAGRPGDPGHGQAGRRRRHPGAR